MLQQHGHDHHSNTELYCPEIVCLIKYINSLRKQLKYQFAGES